MYIYILILKCEGDDLDNSVISFVTLHSDIFQYDIYEDKQWLYVQWQ